MTKTELNAFRSVLQSKQTEVAADTGNREALAIETSPDELDRVQNANDRDYAMSSLARKSSRLNEVRNALRRVEAGIFGICTACGDDISPKRLTAVPWTSFCIACQEAADRQPKTPQDDTDSSLMAA